MSEDKRPELDDEWLEGAAAYNGEKLVRPERQFVLEALSRLLPLAEAYHAHIDPDWDGSVFPDSEFGIARAAIALARGEEPDYDRMTQFEGEV